MSKKSVVITVVVAIILVMIIALTVIIFLYNGILLFNNPSYEDYPVRGVDVSSYQGEIDWEILSDQKIQFAFLKATEGSSWVDKTFEYNYRQAQKTNLRVGAYHFFSYDSPGITQAENFIKTVPRIENMLPPVIDVEFYGDKEKNPPDKEKTQAELKVLINKLEEHYGLTPIVYATQTSYELYIANSFEKCDIWIRDIITKPSLSDKRNWVFWQYTNREKLEGYNGEEKFIDMNVFYGTQTDFDNYAK